MAHDVFICHSSEDRAIANAACAKLESAGVRCWVAPRDAMAGIPYGRQLVDGIGEARLVLLIFSGHANRSEHVLRELEIAADRNKIVVPFRIENVEPTGDLEYYIRRVHWLDAMTPPMEARLRELVALLQRILATIPAHAASVQVPPEVSKPEAARVPDQPAPPREPAAKTLVADDVSDVAIRSAWKWWLAGFVLLAVRTYFLGTRARDLLVGNAPSPTMVLGAFLGASVVLAVYAAAAWLLFAATRRGNNAARRMLQFGWPVATLVSLLGLAASHGWIFFQALALVTALALWIRMAFLLNVTLPQRLPGTATRTEAPAFAAAAVMLIVVVLQLLGDLAR